MKKGNVTKGVLIVVFLSMMASLFAGCSTAKTTVSGTSATPQQSTAPAASTNVDNSKDKTVYVAKIANSFSESAPRYKGMKWFSDELAKRSNGRIKTEYYANAVLGNDNQLFQLIATDSIQLYMGGGWDSLSGKLSLWSIPFTFQSYDEIVYFNNSDFVKNIAKEASKNGIYIPAFAIQGFRNIQTVSKVVKNPEDIKGLKIRAPGQPIILEFFKTLGANPISMPPTDVYTALSTHTIDGQDNLSSNNFGYKISEVAKNFTWIDWTTGVDPIMISDKWYKSLPDDLKKLVDQVTLEMRDKINEFTKQDEFGFSEKIAANSKNTVKVYNDPAIRDNWVKAVAPIGQKFVKDGLYSQKDLDTMNKIVSDYRAQKK